MVRTNNLTWITTATSIFRWCLGCLLTKLNPAPLKKDLPAARRDCPQVAMGHLYFDSVEDFQDAFGPNAEKIMGDIPNFTNSEPVVQISEVVI